MKKLIKLIFITLTTFLFITGCTSTEETASEVEGHKIQVVSSMFPMHEISKKIAGDRADVSLMVGPNEDAHHYEPSAQAIASVNEADIFIYSSDEMEFWVESLLSVVENPDLTVIELGDGLDLTMGEELEEDHDHAGESDAHGHNHGSIDPHFWLNPLAVDQQLRLITEALVAKDPEGREVYTQNQVSFSAELLTLDAAYQEAFKDAGARSFVVQHKAFGHLAHQYNLNQVAVGGLTTEVEPNPKQLAEIVDFVKEQEVPVVYYQSGESSAIAETIADETGTDIGVLYDLEKAPTNFTEETDLYLETMYENLEQLKKSVY